MSILLSLSASNIKGNTKRSATNVLFFIGYCAGCIGSPQLWTHKPRYYAGVITAIVTWICLAVAVVAWWMICAMENRKRDAKATEIGENDEYVEVEKIDLTDKQDQTFRYCW